jgi:hypothetical protein
MGAGLVSELDKASTLISLRTGGAVVLVGTTLLGAGVGAVLAPNRRFVGAVLGGSFGIAAPVLLSLLVLAPLARAKVGAA